MNIFNNYRRILNFFLHRQAEFLSRHFWLAVFRVLRERFNYFDRVSAEEFQSNLQRIEGRPWNLHIELTNICNADCIFCAYRYQTREKIIMEDYVFMKAVDEYCDMGGGTYD